MFGNLSTVFFLGSPENNLFVDYSTWFSRPSFISKSQDLGYSPPNVLDAWLA
jgi:hypothetical protein